MGSNYDPLGTAQEEGVKEDSLSQDGLKEGVMGPRIRPGRVRQTGGQTRANDGEGSGPKARLSIGSAGS